MNILLYNNIFYKYILFVIFIIYDFFDNIITYLEKEGGVKIDANPLDINDNCDSFSEMYTPKHIHAGKNICKLFVKLYKSLIKVNNGSYEQYKKEWNFLNYWLNFNISKNKLNTITCAAKFSEGFSNHCMHTLGFEFPPASSIYNIREDELIKMSLLYGLYENYRKINDILSDSQQNKSDLLLEHCTECCSRYIKANYFCKAEQNKFCLQLDKFKNKYEELYCKLDGKSPEYLNNFMKLSQCKDNNVLSTALIGTTVGLVPILMGLYKVN
ncbi:hypothetical protein PVBG_05637 [Plasmodium vivax Brazil I]|uniref:Uncharacterized protein n=1 Tax=Plasmodium vivax (strain Brazil I) TaxID=1033975 RepID=A0A0J9T1H1_PLAV1|nr:hypothetical protein PVBG_05637 [Plasmodium vivax Brazil I]